MARRGRKRQLDVEAQYWQLLAVGVGTVEACRAVGISRKTGYRWRAENGGLAPGRLAETARRAGTCRCWNGSGSPRCASRAWASGRSPSGWAGRRRRSAGNCAATCAPTTAASTTATWPMPGPGSEPRRPAAGAPDPGPGAAGGGAGQAGAGVEPGADRRATCAAPFPTGRPGMSATRRSTRRSTTAGEAG